MRESAIDESSSTRPTRCSGPRLRWGLVSRRCCTRTFRKPEDVDLAMQAIRPDRPGTAGELGGVMGVKRGVPGSPVTTPTTTHRSRRNRHGDHDREAGGAGRHRRDPRASGRAWRRHDPMGSGRLCLLLRPASQSRGNSGGRREDDREVGVAPRIEIGSVAQAQRYLDLGVRHFCIGWDRFLLNQGFTELGSGLRELLDES